MLKRQRPATPPPSFLSDDAPLLPPHCPSYTPDPSQPRFKRQRTHLREWLQSATPRWESDGEEEWVEDPHDVSGSPLPPSATVNQYKDTNSLLHELHVLNQHRLLFAHSPRDRHHSPVSLPTSHPHVYDPPASQRAAHYQPAPPRDGPSGQILISIEEKGLVEEEVQCVRQRYEDANRFLGLLFLSRRREVEGCTGPRTTS